MDAIINKKNLLKNLFFVVAIFAFSNIAQGQDTKTEGGDIQSTVDSRRFVFKAQSAHPARGRIVYLNSEYDLAVSGDTLRAYLPYYGRAYSAPIDGRGGGIDFTSTNYEYSKKSRKKGGWEITFKPKDVTDVREMFLTVFENGTSSLRVYSNNKEVISYNGFLVEK
jgi:hypothetical protein